MPIPAMQILMRVPMAMFGMGCLSFLPPCMLTKVSRKYFEAFRILIMGRANAGKTTILQRVCATTEQPEIFDGNGNKVCYSPAMVLGTSLIPDIQINMEVIEGSIEVGIGFIICHYLLTFCSGESIASRMGWYSAATQALFFMIPVDSKLEVWMNSTR